MAMSQRKNPIAIANLRLNDRWVVGLGWALEALVGALQRC
jgi:hypothetical protein